MSSFNVPAFKVIMPQCHLKAVVPDITAFRRMDNAHPKIHVLIQTLNNLLHFFK